VAGQPAIVFGFVRIQIVQDDVNFSARMFGDGAVHEVHPGHLNSPAL
jgi:phosphotransferase system IIA component